MGKLTDKEVAAACRYPKHKGRHDDGLFLEIMMASRKRRLYRH
jgi:hypothetical protein